MISLELSERLRRICGDEFTPNGLSTLELSRLSPVQLDRLIKLADQLSDADRPAVVLERARAILYRPPNTELPSRSNTKPDLDRIDN